MDDPGLPVNVGVVTKGNPRTRGRPGVDYIDYVNQNSSGTREVL